MDSGELDFYQHDKVCSNTCRSTKIDLSGARVPLSSPTPAEYLPLTPAAADGTRLALHVARPCCLAPSWTCNCLLPLSKLKPLHRWQGRLKHFFTLSHLCHKM